MGNARNPALPPSKERMCGLRDLPQPALVLVLALGAALAGCGGASSPSSSTSQSKAVTTTSSTAVHSQSVSTMSILKIGRVLVNGQGRTLYVFLPDKHSKVTCVST